MADDCGRWRDGLRFSRHGTRRQGDTGSGPRPPRGDKLNGIVVTHGTATLEETAQRGVLVVMSCRAGAGRILDSHAVRSSGFIPADNLNPQKARILAMLALAKTQDRVEIRRMFDEY